MRKLKTQSVASMHSSIGQNDSSNGAWAAQERINARLFQMGSQIGLVIGRRILSPKALYGRIDHWDGGPRASAIARIKDSAPIGLDSTCLTPNFWRLASISLVLKEVRMSNGIFELVF